MIVITGLGAVTALGRNATETWSRLVQGERGFRELSLFPTEGYRARVVAEVPNFPWLGDLRETDDDDGSRTSELGLLAAREAMVDAGFGHVHPGTDPEGADFRAAWGDRRVGLVMGGSTAGMLETESVLAVLVGPEGAVDPVARQEALRRMLRHPLSAPTDRLARKLGPFRRVRSLSSACSSGANAFVVAATWLELGVVDVVLCGAADALCRVTMSGFHALGALDPNGARPFDRDRQGLTLGEGAGFVVLERAEGAHARGATARCSLLGWSSVSEAHHVTHPEPSGATPVRAMRRALGRAGLAPSDIDYVNAHGTGTRLNDPMESRALAEVFGDYLPRVAVSSSKGQLGHTLGAAGAIEAVVVAMALASDVVPPTGGLEHPDDVCSLHHVLRAEERPVRAALSNSFGFGGMDAVLVFGKGDARPRGEAVPSRARVVVTSVSTLTPGALLAGEDVARLPELVSAAEAVSDDAFSSLDPARSRRLDRAGRLAAVAGGCALDGDADKDIGVVVGSAFGAVDASAVFLRRLAEKGPRLVSPADFPHLVPSAAAGSASIYLGLTGPSMVVADLSTSGECAVLQGFELVARGEASRMLAIAVEERSPIVEQVLAVLFGEQDPRVCSEPAARPVRREGSAAIALASVEAAASRGLPVLAEIVFAEAWRDVEGGSRDIPQPEEGSVVVLGTSTSRTMELLARSPWAHCPRIVCEEHAGTHEAVGGIAAAVAASLVKEQGMPSVLALGATRDANYAFVLRRWGA